MPGEDCAQSLSAWPAAPSLPAVACLRASGRTASARAGDGWRARATGRQGRGSGGLLAFPKVAASRLWSPLHICTERATGTELPTLLLCPPATREDRNAGEPRHSLHRGAPCARGPWGSAAVPQESAVSEGKEARLPGEAEAGTRPSRVPRKSWPGDPRAAPSCSL